MNVTEIRDLQGVLKNVGPGRKVVGYKTTRLTAAGENYGSLMLRLELKLFNENTEEEENLDLVAKMLPPTELLRNIFNVQVTFKNESAIYSTVVPALEEFLKEQGDEEGADFFPNFYGTRISLDPNSDKVDEDAVLILENLKSAGFIMGDRTVGFNLDSSRLLVKKLAHFHAIPLALKLKKPDVFEKKVKPHLTDYIFSDVPMELVKRDTPIILNENPKCVPYIERAQEILERKVLKVVREPFATISHNDYWVNNVLVKYENGKAVANKMVDFQVVEYKSPCRDLVFFLFSSVELNILKEHLDELLDLYYDSFVGKLEALKCDTAPFFRKVFDEELRLACVEAEFFQLMYMLYPIYAEKGSVKELSELAPEDFTQRAPPSLALKERVWYVMLEFVRRGWLW